MGGVLSGDPLAQLRKALRRLHLIVGIVLAIPLAVLGLTGSLLIVLDAPAAAPHHAPREARGAPAPAHDVDDIIAAAESAAPPDYRPTLYVAGLHSAPARVALMAGGRGRSAGAGRPVQLLVDPVTLAVRPAAFGRGSLYAWVHSLHENALAGSVGRHVVGWLGVAMLVLGLSGPFAWWPGRRQLREGFIVRRDAGRFRFFRDVHRTAGIWTFAFLIVLSVTGTFIIFPEPIGRAIAAVFPARAIWRTEVPSVHAIAGTPAMRLDDAIALARATVGPGAVRSIGFARADQPLRIELAPASMAAAGSSVTVLIDPWTRRVVDIRDPRTFTLGERIISALRPLHEGHILGWPWRAALFVIGLCPVFFAITGTTIWALRRRRALANCLRLQG